MVDPPANLPVSFPSGRAGGFSFHFFRAASCRLKFACSMRPPQQGVDSSRSDQAKQTHYHLECEVAKLTALAVVASGLKGWELVLLSPETALRFSSGRLSSHRRSSPARRVQTGLIAGPRLAAHRGRNAAARPSLRGEKRWMAWPCALQLRKTAIARARIDGH